MQESRLFRILYYLLEKGQASAPELAERFEVSVRTIYRDIDALSSAGIPVYTQTGRKGGIRIMDGFILDKAVLSEQEKQNILFALQSLTALKGSYAKDTLEKLSAMFQIRSGNWIEVDLSRWGGNAGDNEKFELLKTAVIQHRYARITYAGSYREPGQRIIKPLKLLYKSKDWYLKAYCTEKQDFRIFKLNRILETELLDERFSPAAYPDEKETGPGNYVPVKLRFSKEMAFRVYDEFSADKIQTDSEGRLTVTAEMPEDAWLVGYILSFGTYVEVLEPAGLKEVVAETAKEIYEKNKP
ncbi:MAG: YafY family transcriptional regulator [Clostridiaceae bacterium]|nr:YafY family transcriptional regulator [Clostridiaceae bacterium]